MLKAKLQTDGGSRGNPGPAGLGFTICDAQGTVIIEGGWFLGMATNNVAEYSAFVWGLQNALEAGITHIEVCADSELMVKQINGAYKVKSEDLKPLFMQAKSLLTQFAEANVGHVYRENNKEADRLANEAMDKKEAVGSYLIPWEEQEKDLFSFVDQGNRYITESTNCVPCEAGKEASAVERNKPYEGLHKISGETYEHAGGHYEMTIKDHFDASHVLVGYDGPCQYLHGHTWDVEATVAGEHLDQVGIFYDFKALKRDLHAVLENFDHRHINDVPPFDVINPTAENMARVIFFELEKTFPAGVYLQEVAVWESPIAKVVFRP